MKKIIQIKILCILLPFILSGCQSEKSKTGDIPVINLSKSYPEKVLNIRDIADVEYIPLETTDDVLLSGSSNLFYVSDNYIAIDDRNSVFIFDRKGKIVSHFNRSGQGPREYIELVNAIFDEKNGEIIVRNSPKNFLVYSMNGEYKRTLKYSEGWEVWQMYNFDDETILVYDNYKEYLEENSERPYMLLSKKDGSIVSVLDIRLPVRYTNRIFQQIDMGGGQTGTTASYFWILNTPYYGEDLVIADMSSDTVYRLSRTTRELTPMLVRTPSVHSSDPPTVWSVPLTTDKFMILGKVTLDRIAFEQGRDVSPEYLMYEFDTGQTYKASFQRWRPIAFNLDIPKNMFAQLVAP